MMKTVLLSAAILVAISFSSCKKEYSCKCTWNTGPSIGETTTISSGGAGSTASKLTKKEAEAWCGDQEYGSDFTCELL